MLHPDFATLGLTPVEGKIYLALLELGGGYVSGIAKKARTPRVNCYHTLEKLTEKGLVSFVTRDNIRYYSAEPPSKIITSLEERVRYAKGVLPELMSLTNTLTFKPKIKYFEGEEGIKNIMEDSLTAKSDLLGYSNLKDGGELFGDMIREYSKEKMRRRIKSRIICPSSPEAFAYTEKYYPKDFPLELIEILFVNPKEF